MMNEPQRSRPADSRDGPAVQPPSALELLQSVGAVTRWDRDEDICGENDDSSYLYGVISGVVRQYRLSTNGRRQIVDLLMPGDFFGLSVGGSHAFSAQAAVAGTFVARYPRDRIEALADSHPAIARALREQLLRTIARLQHHIFVQGRTTAVEKVAGYLLAMGGHVSQPRLGAMVLPVSRYDIADHLGLSVETVSRSITELKNGGLIALDGPRLVTITDRASLEAWIGTSGGEALS